MLGQQNGIGEADVAGAGYGYFHLFNTHIDVVAMLLEQSMFFGID